MLPSTTAVTTGLVTHLSSRSCLGSDDMLMETGPIEEWNFRMDLSEHSTVAPHFNPPSMNRNLNWKSATDSHSGFMERNERDQKAQTGDRAERVQSGSQNQVPQNDSATRSARFWSLLRWMGRETVVLLFSSLLTENQIK